jgi:hypothetical protein
MNGPNLALEPTAYSVRSCLASASGGGSPRALGSNVGLHTGQAKRRD